MFWSKTFLQLCSRKAGGGDQLDLNPVAFRERVKEKALYCTYTTQPSKEKVNHS